MIGNIFVQSWLNNLSHYRWTFLSSKVSFAKFWSEKCSYKTFQCSRLKMFFKLGVIVNFWIITRNTVLESLFNPTRNDLNDLTNLNVWIAKSCQLSALKCVIRFLKDRSIFSDLYEEINQIRAIQIVLYKSFRVKPP